MASGQTQLTEIGREQVRRGLRKCDNLSVPVVKGTNVELALLPSDEIPLLATVFEQASDIFNDAVFFSPSAIRSILTTF